MTDTIIKGTGNSRTLKTVPNALTLYSDFPSMMQALIDGTFPIDIGPLNPAGVDTMGTGLTKATLLKDTTAALYGLGADAVPDDVLKLKLLRMELGNYTGTGKYGPNYANSITFSRPQKIIAIYTATQPSGGFELVAQDRQYWVINMDIIPQITDPTDLISGYGFGLQTYGTFGGKSVDGKTYYWYCSSNASASGQYNRSGVQYYYLGLA